jgi:hypothetical protein
MRQALFVITIAAFATSAAPASAAAPVPTAAGRVSALLVGARQKLTASLAAVRERRAARADWKSWLKENPDLATFNRGARSEEGVGRNRLLAGLHATAWVLSMASIPAGAPVSGGLYALLNAYFLGQRLGDAASALRKANTRTVELGADKVTSERRDRWSRAGIVAAKGARVAANAAE